jgi:hypothetical protein
VLVHFLALRLRPFALHIIVGSRFTCRAPLTAWLWFGFWLGKVNRLAGGFIDRARAGRGKGTPAIDIIRARDRANRVQHRALRDVAKVPEPAVSNRSRAASLFDHLVGALLENPRYVETERLCRFEVDAQNEFGRCLNGKIRGLSPLKDAIDIGRGSPV